MLPIPVERSISLSLGLVFLSNASTLNIHNKNNNERISTSRRVHTNYMKRNLRYKAPNRLFPVSAHAFQRFCMGSRVCAYSQLPLRLRRQ